MLRAPIYGYFKRKPLPSAKVSPRTLLKNLQLAILSGSSESRHIFVVGPPRNGTTLIQKILANHPMAKGPDTETFFFLKRRLDSVRVPEIAEERILDHFFRSRTTAQFFDLIAEEFISSGQRFVEKSPEHSLVIPRILKMFPNSKIIFIYRDGRDAYISALKHKGVRSKLGENYPRLWRDSMLALSRVQSDPRVLPIKYEALCETPEKVLEPVLKSCGLAYFDGLLHPGSYSQTQYSSKKEHQRLQEAISARTVGVHQLPENRQHRVQFEAAARKMLLTFGYNVDESA